MSDRRRQLERIAENGVVGAGGAGFPTHVKLDASADTIILNGAECEPLLHKDKELMRRYADEIVAGLIAAAGLVGAKEVVVGVKGKYEDVIAAMSKLLPAHGRVAPLADAYPSGDELILVYDVTGRIVPPGGIPLHVGCVVLNVETALNIARDVPVTDTYVTVAGAVREPSTLRVPVGVSYGEAVDLAGGATVERPRLLSGGVMMGKLVDSAAPVPKTCGGVIVLDDAHPLIRRYERDWKTIARIGAGACDQCSFCTEFCPRYLLGHPIEPHKAMRSLGFVESRQAMIAGAEFCCECNLCTMMACPEDLDPKNVCAHNKRALAEEGRRWKAEADPNRAALHLNDRRTPISRLITKLGLREFRNEGPLVDRECTPRRVVLPLKQHVGAPARPTVSGGARVSRGDVVAAPADGALGARIHASIDGTCEITDDAIVITAS